MFSGLRWLCFAAHLLYIGHGKNIYSIILHIVQYGIILYNMVSYCTIWYHIVQYGIILYTMVSYCTIWYHIVQYGIILYNISVKLPYLDTLEVSGGVNTTKMTGSSSRIDFFRSQGCGSSILMVNHKFN